MQHIDLSDYKSEIDCFDNSLKQTCAVCPIDFYAQKMLGIAEHNKPPFAHVATALKKLEIENSKYGDCLTLAYYINHKAKLEAWNNLCK